MPLWQPSSAPKPAVRWRRGPVRAATAGPSVALRSRRRRAEAGRSLLFYDELNTAWQRALANPSRTLGQRGDLTLAGAHAVGTAAQVADLRHRMGRTERNLGAVGWSSSAQLFVSRMLRAAILKWPRDVSLFEDLSQSPLEASRSGCKLLILNGEMLERSIRHAWKLL